MADKLRITTEQLMRDISTINENINNIQDSVNKIRAEGASLNAMWDGPSHEMFIQNFEGSLAAVETLLKDIKGYSSALDTARLKYQNCIERVDAFISSIRL